jgi:hypothetical protein
MLLKTIPALILAAGRGEHTVTSSQRDSHPKV